MRHPAHFYANDRDMVIVPVKELIPSPFTLTRDEYRKIAEAMATLGYPEGLDPPKGAAHIKPPSA